MYLVGLRIVFGLLKRVVPGGKRVFNTLLQQLLWFPLQSVGLKHALGPGHKLRDVVPGQFLTGPGGLTSPPFEQIISYQLP